MSIRSPLTILSSRLRAWFRKKRWNFFWLNVGQFVGSGYWLDLGGDAGGYLISQIHRSKPVILLDLEQDSLIRARAKYPQLLAIVADGEHLPFKDQSIACIFCNSVIEHVQDPMLLSMEIERSGQTYFVQTPNGNFFAEPHSFIPIPFYRKLPQPIRKVACRVFHASFNYIESVSYISKAELSTMFPTGDISYESWLGMTKSFFVSKRGIIG